MRRKPRYDRWCGGGQDSWMRLTNTNWIFTYVLSAKSKQSKANLQSDTEILKVDALLCVFFNKIKSNLSASVLMTACWTSSKNTPNTACSLIRRVKIRIRWRKCSLENQPNEQPVCFIMNSVFDRAKRSTKTSRLSQGRSQTQNLGGGGANIFWENKISEVDFIHFYENW